MTQKSAVNGTKNQSSFSELLDTHRHLEELFYNHQEALLDLDVSRALQVLLQFEVELKKHIELEEEHLMPIYKMTDFSKGGAPEIFINEHRKLVNLLCDLRKNLEILISRPCVDKKNIIEILDSETMFKKVFSHHDKREEALFFPAIDSVTTPDERRTLLDLCL
ncbi:hemerythrin domain-containing protein [candidate division KSB1 bacterium]|nr:hemerythrin domain-containing protein [candidate division KSB1 bacterium]